MTMSRSQRAILFSALGTLVVGSVVAVSLFAGRSDDQAGGPEPGNDLGEEKQGRIEAAREAFTRHLSETPQQARTYLVSFGGPVSVAKLLGALEDEDPPALELEDLFTWLATEDSDEVITGSHSADDLGWPGAAAAEVASGLRILSLEVLDRQLETLGPGRQLDETKQIRRQVSREGVALYGIRCACSPAALTDLTEVVADLSLRAVEEHSLYDQPIWPRSQ